jgi:deoxyribodipyrimidine photo-lyase
LDDNPALYEAAHCGLPVIPIYIWSPEEEGMWPPGAASRWWLHQSLQSLKTDLARLGSQLVLEEGPTPIALEKLIRERNAGAVYWNRRYEPAAVELEAQIERDLVKRGVKVEAFNASLLFEPWEIKTKKGDPFQVFAPFWRSCLASSHLIPDLLPKLKRLTPPHRWPRGLSLSSLGLEPTIDWAGGLRETWSPGENGAKKRLREFLRDRLASYAEDRHRADEVGTSMLSPHLHFGEIGPRRIWHEVQDSAPQIGSKTNDNCVQTFLSEIGWREFSYHLLHHFPQTPESPLKQQFASFPWKRNSKLLSVWRQGRTGYPIVDAAMRHLWATGWMPNRARMIVASFLTKDLLIPWQEGAKWFWDTLVDADLANNTLGWQWTAGCGADAAPFFRIFNPVTQGEKFDPKGKYVRNWVPELESVPDRWVHKPWGAPERYGEGTKRGYPPPIVDHAEARVRALQAYESLKATSHP